MRTASAVVIALSALTSVLGQGPDTVFLEQMTWMEVRDAVSAGLTTVIIPTGGGPSRTSPIWYWGSTTTWCTTKLERSPGVLGTLWLRR